MWVRRSELRRILEQVRAAEVRASAAESALAVERRERMADVRHVMSMFLRREKSFPLPPTAEEKEQVAAEVEARKNEPIPLTDVQIAMRDANRKEAAKWGKSQEEADRDFEREFLSELME